jgi:hypothetical protein
MSERLSEPTYHFFTAFGSMIRMADALRFGFDASSKGRKAI